MPRCSDNYLKWIKQANLPPLTNTEYKFAEWLISNKDDINALGDLDSIFKSVRKFVKNNSL